MTLHRLSRALAAAGLAVAVLSGAAPSPTIQGVAFDPLLSDVGRACGPAVGARPAVLERLVAAAAGKNENAPKTGATN